MQKVLIEHLSCFLSLPVNPESAAPPGKPRLFSRFLRTLTA